MANPQDPKIKAVAEKAWRGAHLLAVGDYQGAILVCTEALELDPGSIGAVRTLKAARAGVVYHLWLDDGYIGEYRGELPLVVGSRFPFPDDYFQDEGARRDATVVELTPIDRETRANVEFKPIDGAPRKGDMVKIFRYGSDDKDRDRIVLYDASLEFEWRCLCFLGWVGVTLNEPIIDIQWIDPDASWPNFARAISGDYTSHFFRDIVEVQFDQPCTEHGHKTGFFLVEELSEDIG